MSLRHNAVWRFLPRNPAVELALVQELGLPPLVGAALATRGISTAEQAHKFLNPDLAELHSPKNLPDIDAAVRCILAAKEAGDTIYLHGDYDVDGITSTTLFYKFLTKIGCHVIPHVPHRTKEGYGINEDMVDEAARLGAKLFLTCDCGSNAVEQIKKARALRMKVVVTDHHQLASLPDAEAIVNPHRADSRYPFAELCGVGVVFKVCQAITEELKLNVASFQSAYLDLVALGTVADAMPLIDENRILVAHGLRSLTDTKKVGLRAIYEKASLTDAVKRGLTTYEVGFQLGPRINAIGRMDDAAIGLKLMLTTSVEQALELASQLEAANNARRSLQQEITNEAIDMVLASGLDQAPIIVLRKDEWPQGLVGLVAGKLCTKFSRPTIVLHYDERTQAYSGSGRSIPQVDLGKMIRAHPGLIGGGGHAMAAGIKIEGEKYETAVETLTAYTGQLLEGVDLRPMLDITAELNLGDVNLGAVEQLAKLQPYGMGNPTPTFAAKGITLEVIKPLKNPAHLHLFMKHGGSPSVRFTAFNFGEVSQGWRLPMQADVAFELGVNDYKGSRSVDWKLSSLGGEMEGEPIEELAAEQLA